MRWAAVIPFVLLCFSGCKSSSTTGVEQQRETDFDRMQGVWVAETYEIEGRSVGAGVLKNTRLVIKGARMELFETSEIPEEINFDLYEEPTPRQIDLLLMKGRDAGQRSEGIYRLQGDTLQICVGAPGQQRPTEFTTSNGMAKVCLKLHRHHDSD